MTSAYSRVGTKFVEYWASHESSTKIDQSAVAELNTRIGDSRTFLEDINEKIHALSDSDHATSPSSHRELSVVQRQERVRDLRDRAASEEKTLVLHAQKLEQLYERQARSILSNVPVVEIAVKITEVAEYDMRGQHFNCKAILMLNWRDESLGPVADRDPTGRAYAGNLSPQVLRHHFCPAVTILDVSKIEVEGRPLYALTSPGSKGPERCDVKYTLKLKLAVGSVPDLRNFPFDIQILQLQFQLKKLKFYKALRPQAADATEPGSSSAQELLSAQTQAVTKRLSSKGAVMILTDPVTWRPTEGHKIEADADWNAEFDMLWIDGSNLRDFTDKSSFHIYVVQLALERATGNLFWNVIVPMLILVLLGITPFASSVSDTEDRIGVLMLIAYAVIGFKFYLDETLPDKRTITTLDTYLNLSLLYLLFFGLYFMIAGFLYVQVYNCGGDYAPSCYYVSPLNFSCDLDDDFHVNNCNRLEITEGIFLGLSVASAIALQLALVTMWRCRVANAKKEKNSQHHNKRGVLTHMVDLGDSKLSSRFPATRMWKRYTKDATIDISG